MSCENCPAIPALARATGQSEAVVRISLGLPEQHECTACGHVYDSRTAARECADFDDAGID